jgi:hypothetical protein
MWSLLSIWAGTDRTRTGTGANRTFSRAEPSDPASLGSGALGLGGIAEGGDRGMGSSGRARRAVSSRAADAAGGVGGPPRLRGGGGGPPHMRGRRGRPRFARGGQSIHRPTRWACQWWRVEATPDSDDSDDGVALRAGPPSPRHSKWAGHALAVHRWWRAQAK